MPVKVKRKGKKRGRKKGSKFPYPKKGSHVEAIVTAVRDGKYNGSRAELARDVGCTISCVDYAFERWLSEEDAE